MKFSVLLTVALLIGILSSNAQAQSGPMLWTSYIDILGNYLLSNSESDVVSRFTPGVAITVSRMQLQATQGGYVYRTGAKCHPLPKVRVTDGSTTYALAVPNARNVGPYGLSVHADSGPIMVSFPANAELRLSMFPGETGCYAGGIHVTVQYSVN
jgi:hypothetical protein